jgi:hypothetical protein
MAFDLCTSGEALFARVAHLFYVRDANWIHKAFDFITQRRASGNFNAEYSNWALGNGIRVYKGSIDE